MPTVDMSPKAVSRRLQQVNELRKVCLFLGGPRIQKPWGIEPLPRSPAVAREAPAVYRTKTGAPGARAGG